MPGNIFILSPAAGRGLAGGAARRIKATGKPLGGTLSCFLSPAFAPRRKD